MKLAPNSACTYAKWEAKHAQRTSLKIEIVFDKRVVESSSLQSSVPGKPHFLFVHMHYRLKNGRDNSVLSPLYFRQQYYITDRADGHQQLSPYL
jgi:hypothetical protein